MSKGTGPGTANFADKMQEAAFPSTGKFKYCPEDGGYMEEWGLGAPTDTEEEMCIGAVYHDKTNGKLYVNVGTVASATWKLVTQAS